MSATSDDFSCLILIFLICQFIYLQVVAKLHAILRPFLLRRMKSDVELMLPRKKEILLYATMTDYQKTFQDHLVNKTLEGHILEKSFNGKTTFHLAHSRF